MKSIIHLAFVIIFVLSSSIPVLAGQADAVTDFSCADVTEIPTLECEALVALYNSTNGPGWTINPNWLVVNTPSYWYGVTVESGHVIGLNISSNNLVGRLPGGLGNLTNLKELVLWMNQLNGSIPVELGNLTNLTDLYLDENQLSGSIPATLGNLVNLQRLILDENQLSGSIPVELGNLTQLSLLRLGWNHLSGSIPIELGNLNNLTSMDLSNNQLSGSIPIELGDLTNLQYLYLYINQLSGSIPPELGNLSNLTSLDLQLNKLSGSIPPELGDLTNLKYLYLGPNQLTGSIPPELGDLTNLKGLYLGPNQLSGSIPADLGKLANLLYLALNENQFSGSIPVELGNLTNLYTLSLESNQLSGSIPTELGDLTNLTWLELDSNQLSGSIPAGLGNLTNLYHLWLQDNLLEGEVPSSFINLVNLYDPGQYSGDGLDLDYNLLNVPPGYPDPLDPLQIFLHQKDPDWQLYQGFEQVVGSGGGEITSLDGRTDFVIPPGAVVTDTTFAFMPFPAPRHASGLRAFANNSFDLSAEDGTGNPVTAFNLPISVTLNYSDTDFGPEDALGLYYWDTAGMNWTDAVTTCPGGEYTRDLEGNMLALSLCHLTEFGLFGNPLNIFLPVIRR